MTDLLSRPFLRRTEPAWGSTVPWLAGVLAAAWALVAGLAIAALPAILVWIDEGASAPVGDPVRIGGQIWLAGHRVGLQIGNADVQFAPLGMTVVAILLLYRAARWAAHTAGVSTLRKAVLVVLPAVGLYAVGAWGLAVWSMTMSVSVDPLVASVWAGLTAAVGTGVGVVHEADLGGRLIARLPAWAVSVLGGAAVAVAGLLAVGALLVAMSAITHSDRIAAVGEALDPDLPGMLALAMAGAALVPNAVVWAASYALGPGFALGAGTSVAPGAVELGIVPALPALAAVPADAPGPWGWLVLAGPIGVGVLTGAGIRRLSASGRVGMVGEAFGAAAIAALVMGGLATLSGGSVGAARMSVVGPVPWEPALATFLVVGIPAVIVAALRGRRA
jgi:Family of unknown function (DUF6350)